MAKTQEALLSEVVQLLRKQNALSTRDRLRETEEAKRQEKLTATTTDTSATTGMMIDSATDFQRRYLAGQAKTLTDKALGNKPTGTAQDLQVAEALKSNSFLKGATTGVLTNIYERLGTTNSILRETHNLFFRSFNQDRKQIVKDNKFRLKSIRDANEKRLEGIKGPGANAAGFGGRFNNFDISDADIVDGGDDGMSPLTAGVIGAGSTGIGAALLLKMKKIKKFLGIGTRFGFKRTMMARFGLLGKNLFAKRGLSAKNMKLAKNPRMWPLLLAAVVATSFLNDSAKAEKEFAEEATAGGSPNGDGASGPQETLMEKSLSAANTGLNVWIGYSIANWVSKKMLKKTLFQAAKAMLIKAGASTAGRTLGAFALRGLLAVGLGGAAFSAPVWGGILLAAYAGYKLLQWSTAMTDIQKMETEPGHNTDATRHPPMPTAGIIAPTELISAKMLNAVDIASAPGSMMDGIQANQNKMEALALLRGTPIGARRQAVYKALIAKGWKKSELDMIMKERGLPDISTMPAPKVPDMFLKSNLAKIANYVSPDIYNRGNGRVSARQLQLSQQMAGGKVFGSPDGPLLKPFMNGMEYKSSADLLLAPGETKRGSGDVIIKSLNSGSADVIEIKNYNTYEPSWGGATGEAYERHSTFGGNGAGNWF